MPRQLDSVWNYFEKVVQIGKTGCRAKCKRCSKDIQGIVARMKCHVDICRLQLEEDVDANTPEDVTDEMPLPVPSSNPVQSPMRKRPRLIESYTTRYKMTAGQSCTIRPSAWLSMAGVISTMSQ